MELGVLHNAMKCWTEGYMVKIRTIWAVCCILEGKVKRLLDWSADWSVDVRGQLQCGLNLDRGLGY